MVFAGVGFPATTDDDVFGKRMIGDAREAAFGLFVKSSCL